MVDAAESSLESLHDGRGSAVSSNGGLRRLFSLILNKGPRAVGCLVTPTRSASPKHIVSSRSTERVCVGMNHQRGGSVARCGAERVEVGKRRAGGAQRKGSSGV